MIDSETSPLVPPAHRSRGFVVGYGLAQAGAYIAFIPLLALLLPEKAQQIAGVSGAGLLLSQVAMIGGLTAAGANLLFGALSDRTDSRLGRRRPWIVGGFIGVAASLALIGRADGVLPLILGVILFQLAVNALYSPLSAIVPDLVPDAQKGLISAWAGAALPVANLFTALIISRFAGALAIQYGLVIVVAGILILPFALRLNERRTPPRAFSLSLVAFRDPIFTRAFVSRLLAESAVAINTLYILLWLRTAPASILPQGWSAMAGFGVLLVVTTLAGAASGFIGGVVSDRMARRRLFVCGGALAMAGAFAMLLLASSWPWVLAAQILFGAAHGLHTTTVTAMTAEILRDPGEAGRDLGVMNIAVALPQSLAPGLAAIIFALHLSIDWVFIAGGGAAALSAVVLAIQFSRRDPLTPIGGDVSQSPTPISIRTRSVR